MAARLYVAIRTVRSMPDLGESHQTAHHSAQNLLEFASQEPGPKIRMAREAMPERAGHGDRVGRRSIATEKSIPGAIKACISGSIIVYVSEVCRLANRPSDILRQIRISCETTEVGETE